VLENQTCCTAGLAGTVCTKEMSAVLLTALPAAGAASPTEPRTGGHLTSVGITPKTTPKHFAAKSD